MLNLLYCDANGNVVAWHDVSAPPVAKDAYPAVSRIIPYPNALSTLARVGDPPPPPWKPSWGDPRPYASPPPTPPLLTAYAGQVRWEKATAGITFNAASGAIPVACDRVSQGLIGNLLQYAETVAGTTQIDFTQDGKHYPLLASEVPALFNAVNALIQQVRTIEAGCIADLNNGTANITGATWDGTATTSYTTSVAHGYAVGDTVVLSGNDPPTYNGTFTAANGTSGSTLVVDMTTDPGAFVSGGSLAVASSTLKTYDDVDNRFAGVK